MNVGKEANCRAFLLDILGDVPPSIFIVPMGRGEAFREFDPTVFFRKDLTSKAWLHGHDVFPHVICEPSIGL